MTKIPRTFLKPDDRNRFASVWESSEDFLPGFLEQHGKDDGPPSPLASNLHKPQQTAQKPAIALTRYILQKHWAANGRYLQADFKIDLLLLLLQIRTQPHLGPYDSGLTMHGDVRKVTSLQCNVTI
jgi:hypothetical protein